jgi:DNA-directed RNA polymerase specialized sigma24 family protein
LEYASAQDFCRIFHQDMAVLYWLALALTADAAKAEQCFVAALDECVGGNAVFKEWARSWSRRVVIKNAIRLMSPRPGAGSSPTAIRASEKPGPQAEAALAALATLQPFDRFVFVVSVLEGYADRDCTTLLGCSPPDLAAARLRAFQQIRREIELSPALRKSTQEIQSPTVLSEAEVA